MIYSNEIDRKTGLLSTAYMNIQGIIFSPLHIFIFFFVSVNRSLWSSTALYPHDLFKEHQDSLDFMLTLKRDDVGLPPFFVSKQQLSRATLVYSKDIRKTGMLAGNLWWSDKFFTRIIDGAGCVVCMTSVHSANFQHFQMVSVEKWKADHAKFEYHSFPKDKERWEWVLMLHSWLFTIRCA